MPLQLFKIESVEVSTPILSVTFNNIPQSYTDLIIVSSARTDRNVFNIDGIKAEFNGVTTGYSVKWIQGDGSSIPSITEAFFAAGWTTQSQNTVNAFGNSLCYISNYTSNKNKLGSTDAAGESMGTSLLYIANSIWLNTSAITSIALSSSTGNLLQPSSTFTLYGIL